MERCKACQRSHQEFPGFVTLNPMAFPVYHSPTPNLQHGKAKKPCFQWGEGKGGNKLGNTIRGHEPLALPLCAHGEVPDPFWSVS